MKRRFHPIVCCLMVLMLLAVAAPAQASAQAQIPAQVQVPADQRPAAPGGGRQPAPAVGTSKRGGVTISPAFQQVTMPADQPEKVFEFSVTNNATVPYEFALSVVDFGSLDETGGVLFVGNAEKQLSYKYALSQWVTLGKDRVVVEPNATEKIPVTIENKESLAPGGHYGAVLVTPTEVGSSGSQKVQIDQVVSSLLFVKKQGGEVYKLGLSDFSVRPHIFQLPDEAKFRFQNSGNVHVTPRGIVTVKDPRGTIVRRGIINPDSGIILPESFRQLRASLTDTAKPLVPGRYTLSVAYRYDDTVAFKTVEKQFLYLNLGTMLLLAILAAAVVVLAISRTLRRRLVKVVRSLFRQLWTLPSRITRK